MSSPPLPACPKCGRRIAAWRIEHCVYCGAAFPPDFKQGVPEPEALNWVERPGIPPDAAKQLEMMKVVPLDRAKRPRSLVTAAIVLSVPVFVLMFYMLYSMVARSFPQAGGWVLMAALIFFGYLAWTFYKARRG